MLCTPRPILGAGLTALLAVTSTATAQFDFDLSKGSPGTIAPPFTTYTLNSAGAVPGQVLVQLISTNQGPSPLSLLSAGDTRSLLVGTELLSSVQFTLVAQDGTASVTYALPNNPSLQGLVGYAQAFTLSATPSPGPLAKQISNPVAAQLGLQATARPAPFNLSVPRALGFALDAAVGPQGDFDVVFAGGGSGTLLGGSPLADVEVVSGKDLTVTTGANQGTARLLHTATKLQDGRWLLVGGIDSGGNVFRSCEIFDPATRTFSPTSNMTLPRGGHAATLLPDGRVLVAGGTQDFTTTTATLAGTLNNSEVFDPTTGTWTFISSPLFGRLLGPGLHTLSDGRVMLTGGVRVSILFNIPTAASSSTSCQFFNPANSSWTTAPSMQAPHAQHDTTSVNLPDGRLLVTGGIDVPSLLTAINAGSTAAAEVFDPVANTWTRLDMGAARATHSLTVLGDGRVLAAGGAQGTFQTPAPIDSTEIFNPATNSWAGGPLLGAPRAGHSAVRMNDGLLLLIGGFDAANSTGLIESLHF